MLISGHSTLKFPDGSDFEVNSKYYLFISQKRKNCKIKKSVQLDNPKLSIYR